MYVCCMLCLSSSVFIHSVSLCVCMYVCVVCVCVCSVCVCEQCYWGLCLLCAYVGIGVCVCLSTCLWLLLRHMGVFGLMKSTSHNDI